MSEDKVRLRRESGFVAQLVEHTLDKRGVGGSSPPRPTKNGGIAQLVEHLLCKQGVIGSIPFASTNTFQIKAS